MSKTTQHKKEKALKKTEPTEKIESVDSAAEVCCHCRAFRNHPGFCRTKNQYCARKAAACSDFKDR